MNTITQGLVRLLLVALVWGSLGTGQAASGGPGPGSDREAISARIKHFRSLAVKNNQAGNRVEALRNLSSALELAEQSGDSLEVASICFDLGSTYYDQFDLQGALGQLNRAKRLAEGCGDEKLLKSVFDKLTMVCTFMGQYDDAVEYNAKAAGLAGKSGDENEKLLTELNLGIIYKHQGNKAKALEIFLHALPFYQKTRDKEVLNPLANCIGRIYIDNLDYKEAIPHLSEALEISRELGLTDEVASNLGFLAMARRNMGQYGEALALGKESLDLYTKTGNKEGMARVLMEMGDTWAAKDDFSRAKEYYSKALDLAREIGDPYQEAACLRATGKLLASRAGKAGEMPATAVYNQARDCYMQALAISGRLGQPDQDMESYLALYRIDSITGNFEGALKNYLGFTRCKDTLDGIERRHRMAGLQVQFVREQKNREIAQQEKEIKQQRMQRNGILFTALLLLLTAGLFIRSSLLRKSFEKQQAVARERERISADLHDDIGSGLSKIILMSEVLKREAGTDEVRARTSSISEESQELSRNLSEVIWALNTRYDSVESLVAYIRRYAGGYFEDTGIRFRVNAPAVIPYMPLTGEQRRNLFYAVKEALHNIVKHAGASEAEIQVILQERVLEFVIRDNGTGMPEPVTNRFGNGIIQMKNRLEKMGGSFSVTSDAGTSIRLRMPV